VAILAARNAEAARPVHVVHLSVADGEPVATHPRVLVVAEPCSKIAVIETYATAGDGPRFTNAVTEIVVQRDADVEHDVVNAQSLETSHVGTVQIHQFGGRSVTNVANVGCSLVRNDLRAVLDAEGCECTFNGLTLAEGSQHVDNHLWVDHAKPHCRSWEFFKGVYDDRSSGAFCGRIYVAEDAQKTDAKQTNMNLLLTDEATVNTRPQLEIFADDVKCTHGATIGQIEEDALFYLKSRGIGDAAARSLLVFAFANECLEEISFEPLHDRLTEEIVARLPRGDLLRGVS
jgi:Fe-S cluster assembly protein SufD